MKKDKDGGEKDEEYYFPKKGSWRLNSMKSEKRRRGEEREEGKREREVVSRTEDDGCL